MLAAGRSGRVVTLLKEEDVRHFKLMLRKVDNSYVKDFKMKPDVFQPLEPKLERALQQVQELLAEESTQQRGQQHLDASNAASRSTPRKRGRADKDR